MSTVSNEWRWTRLNELVANPKDDIVDGPFGSRLKASEYVEKGIPIVRLQNIDRNRFINKNIKFVTSEKAKEIARHHFIAGDILISKLGDPLGETCIAPDDLSYGILVADVVRVRPSKAKIDTSFLCYALNSAPVVAQFKTETKGTTRPRVNLNKIRSLVIPVVDSLDEQRRVVAEIEKQFTRLEAGIGALRRVQANLKRYRTAVLKAACEGHLVATEAELARQEGRDYETGAHLLQRILIERRQKWNGHGRYKEPAAPDIDRLQLPEGWAWATVEQLTFLVTSGSRGWGDFYSNSGPLFIRAQDIKTDSLRMSGVARVAIPKKAEGTRSSVEKFDLLITITGANVTKSAIVRGLNETAFVSQHVALLKPVFREVSPFMFTWIVSSAHGRKRLEEWAYGAGKPGLSLQQVRTLPIALPPLAEQTRIVSEVERRLSLMEELEAVVTANLRRATRLRQSILQRAFAAGLNCA